MSVSITHKKVYTLAKKKIPPLALELKQDPTTLHYLSLLEYRRDTFLVVIDNITETEVSAFTLDYAEQEGIVVADFLSICNYWFYKASNAYPLSFEIAKLGLTKQLAPMLKIYDANNVSRIVGVPFQHHMQPLKPKIKRRRVVPVQAGIEIIFKKQQD